MKGLEELQLCPHGSCPVGKEKAAWQKARQGLDQAGPYKPYKRFWYLSQETLKDFKQENDMINLHPSFF